MEYRKLPGTDLNVSTIGIGASHLHELTQEQMDSLVDFSLEQGINMIDAAVAYPVALDLLGKSIAGRREKFYYQMHLGMTFPDEQYLRTRKKDEVQKGFEAQLQRMHTDYADFGYVHYVDDAEDFEAVMNGGTMEYARKLKQQGTIRYLGFATHNVTIASRFIATGEFDIGMFSINAAYDLDPVSNVPFDEYDVTGHDRLAVAKDRERMYRECEKSGVGLTAMKPYGGGILLDDRTSPFGKAMSIYQCLQYALDRPAMLSCFLGVSSLEEMKEAVGFFASTPQERDYSFISNMQPKEMRGTCVYCNHCLPCPANIDIAAVHKFVDLYHAGDALAKEHYYTLPKRATDCIQCGQCEARCPFGVEIRAKMRDAINTMA